MTKNLPNKLRVWIIASVYPPHLGGVERFSASLAQTLSKTCDVTVLTLNTENQPFERREGPDGNVRVLSLPCLALFSGRLPLPTLSALKTFSDLLQNEKPDAALIQTRLYPFNACAVRALTRASVQTLTIEHGTGHIDFHSPLINQLWHGYEHALIQPFIRSHTAFYGVSRAAVEWLAHFGIHGHGVIPNGVNEPDFNDLPVGARQRFNIAADDFLIVFAGRLLPEKGALELPESVQRINDPRMKIIFAGAGDEKIENTLRTSPNVAAVTTLPHRDWLGLLSEADVLCLPTRYPEGLPTVILEAGMLNKAVIASDAGGIVEVIRDGESGLLVPSGDCDALADALVRLRDEPELRKALGERLGEIVRADYTWEKIGIRVLKILESERS